MGERRLSALGAGILWFVCVGSVGALFASGSGCAQGSDGSFGDGGFGGGEEWTTGPTTATGTGTGGASGSQATTSTSTGSGTGGACVPEVCNGQDDDCNGFVDDSPIDVGGGCTTTQLGVCSEGSTKCQSGKLVCVALTAASAEKCNGLDDDCDGTIDNGNPGGGSTCSTGMSGPCATGTLVCSGGVPTCQAVVSPVPEVCTDNVDNDCNGVVDDGCGGTGGTGGGGSGCAHSPCVSGVALAANCDICADTICNGGIDTFCCATSWDTFCVTEASTYCTCP